MSRRWRWCFVAVIAATMFGSFMPHALLSGSSALANSTVATIVEEAPVAPTGCLDLSCGKSVPAAANPVLTVAALTAVLVGALAFATVAAGKRHRASVDALPRGMALMLFRPPQFS
jgi:hypothetical protein